MSKKILPIIAVVGASALVVGISNTPIQEDKKENFIQHINSFENEVEKYSDVTDSKLTSTVLNKYNLTIEENLDDVINQDLTEFDENLETENENYNSDISAENLNENEYHTIVEENLQQEEIEKFSTLYSLSNDIENSCDDFCELKEEITSAIIETQNLINKVQQKELELTNEQRLFITEQAQQLKNLGRQLSSITTELSFNLSDLNQIMSTNNENIDSLSLKYLVVLDNLVNGNEMLQSGLSSLNLINQMFNMRNNNIPSNNQGRVLYGFRHNDNPPVVKDYYIDENGDLIQNKQENTSQNNEENLNENNSIEVAEENKSNIDTYDNPLLNSNLDTYNNKHLPRNIDSFFNTALLDNEFMYGNGNYGYGVNGYAMNNPYMHGYANYEKNTSNGVNGNYNTQDNVAKNNNERNNKKQEKEKKRFKLKKNIDTFKDENEPDIKTKLGNIKNSITGFFGKFKKSDLDDKIENPITRHNLDQDQY